jgi:uncharacterized membrane protein YoaK (UPF0700 family)
VVVLAANLVTGKSAQISYLLSVPVFMLVLYLTRALAISIERFGLPALRPLLFTQLLFLAACLELCVFFGPWADPQAAAAIVAEPPRVCRRPQLLRGWGYGSEEEDIE